MGCKNCGTGGCGTTPAGCKNNGNCGTSGCNKLDVFDWLVGMQPTLTDGPPWVEVRFKNTRKEFYVNTGHLPIVVGDVIAVEVQSGFDIGVVSLTGELVRFQMKKYGVKDSKEQRKILRKATESDIQKWKDAQEMERPALVKTRKIIRDLKLNMKLSDVEFQGDKNRATFFYIAEERVDFRELIKVLADQFRVRVEMRQIGARQEAGRVGGIGSCGRELCCSSWLTDFRTVTTTAARYQQLSINPMKLAGQCGKLKCCLNYELDAYVDALKDFPDSKKKLRTKKGNAFHQKSDIFKGMMWYSYEDNPSEFIPLKTHRVREVLAMNEQGKSVEDLLDFSFKTAVIPEEKSFENVVGQDELTRFDRKDKGKNKGRGRDNRRRNRPPHDKKEGKKP